MKPASADCTSKVTEDLFKTVRAIAIIQMSNNWTRYNNYCNDLGL